MADTRSPGREGTERMDRRRRALECMRRPEATPQGVLAGEAEASLCSAFALADLLNALQRQ